jgi:hypothetical protein
VVAVDALYCNSWHKNEDNMKFEEIIEALIKSEFKPRDYNLIREQASWVFSSLRDQFAFVILLDDVLTGAGYVLSDPPDTDGAVQRIDYLYLKQYAGFEIFVHWDFKVEFQVFKYV